MMRKIALLLALLLTLPAHARPATLTGQWQPDGFQIAWQADAPACLMVDNELLGDVLCASTGQVVLARGGDAATLAAPGRVVQLRSADAIHDPPLAHLVIPEEIRRLVLPVVLGR